MPRHFIIDFFYGAIELVYSRIRGAPRVGVLSHAAEPARAHPGLFPKGANGPQSLRLRGRLVAAYQTAINHDGRGRASGAWLMHLVSLQCGWAPKAVKTAARPCNIGATCGQIDEQIQPTLSVS